MKKINFQNDVTKVNAETFNTFQNNIEEAVVPEGGTTGQILTKISNENNEVNWTDPIETQVINSLNAESTTSALSAYQGKVLNNRLMNVEDSSIYSTEETKVGTWIDGKPIYRKVILLTASTSTKSLSISSIISNIESIWINSSKSFYKIASGGSGMISDWEVSGARFKAVIDIETLYYVCSDPGYSKAEITLEYTKTTD